MFTRRGRFARPDCEHEKTVTVRNAGIERAVCETCGHVSFRGMDGVAGTASRNQFERESERSPSQVG
ncbi:MAG: hypothetical protein WAL25_01195 [Acidimicrobiia bacterium]